MQLERDGKQYVVAEGHEWFWPGFADGSWEPTTFKIFDKFLNKDEVFVDIGAWIGPTVLYAAPKAKKVFCFEPDPVAYKSLTRNLALNRIENVIPYPVAVSSEFQGIPFGAKTQLGDSMSSSLWAKRELGGGVPQVPAISLESIVFDINPGFIKIDIEGGEKALFSGPTRPFRLQHPPIHLSLHTPWFTDDLEAYKKAIMDGLSDYQHFYDENLQPIKLEDAFNINAFNSIVATHEQI